MNEMLNSHTEIERRFLWNYKYNYRDCLSDTCCLKYELIKDIYLNSHSRLRKTNDNFLLTVKGEGNIRREEYEVSIDNKLAMQKLFDNSSINCLTKRRVTYIFNGINYEVNIFEKIKYNNVPLILVECELKFEGTTLVLPDWIGKEVTTDNRFNGYSLFRLFEYQHFSIEEN